MGYRHTGPHGQVAKTLRHQRALAARDDNDGVPRVRREHEQVFPKGVGDGLHVHECRVVDQRAE